MEPQPRQMGFDPSNFNTKLGEPFTRVIRAVAGVGNKDKVGQPLMSSLPSELTFNDLRDTAPRHMKKERAIPANIHSTACRSIIHKPGGCSTLDLSQEDWAVPLKSSSHAGLRTSVCSAVRTTDVSLGVNCSGLTKHKSNRAYTKPHILVSRFELLSLMADVFHSCDGNLEAKTSAVHDAVKNLWLCRLLRPNLFIQIGDGLEDDFRFLVISCGPNCIKTIKLQKVNGDEFGVASSSYTLGCKHFSLSNLNSVQVRSGDKDKGL